MELTKYTLRLSRNGSSINLSLTANDMNHAQAQSMDISRALKADNTSLLYEPFKECELSKLFRKLAFNEYTHENCEIWENSFCNEVPVIYALKTRYYIRPMVLDYLEIHRDGCVKPSCGNKTCINPYHNSYKKMKGSKLGDADINLAVAFASQGVPIKEIAKVLKVNRSTIYRTLNREHLHSGSACN